MLLVLLIVLLLFGGGLGVHYGGPVWGGGSVGTILVIVLILWILGVFR